MNKDITIIPEDYIVVHSKTTNIQKLFDDGSCVYEVEKKYIPIIRCKDCKYRTELFDTRWHPCTDVPTNDEWFCADGEKKERASDE